MTKRTLLSTVATVALLGVAVLATGAGVEVSTDAASEGTYGLEVNLGPDCPSDHFLELDSDDGPLSGTYEACRSITASAVSVDTGQATLRAGDGVGMGDGFAVQNGAELRLVLDGSLNGGPTYVEDRSPIDENVYSARFSARFDDLTLGANENVGSLVALSGDHDEVFRVVVEPNGSGGYQFLLEARQDGGGMVQSPPGSEIQLPSDWVVVALEWSAGSGDGQLLVGINGAGLQGLSDLDNGAQRIETIRFGGVDGALFDGTTSFQLDSFSSTR